MRFFAERHMQYDGIRAFLDIFDSGHLYARIRLQGMSSVRRQHRASEGGQLATGGTANPSVSYDADFQFGDTLQWPSPGCPSPLFDVAIISGNGSEVVQQKRKGMIRNFFDTIIWHIRDPRADSSRRTNIDVVKPHTQRSEERRVGKECYNK